VTPPVRPPPPPPSPTPPPPQGLLMLFFSLYLVLNEKKLLKQTLDEIFGMLFGGCWLARV
jgi:hypothetical protein